MITADRLKAFAPNACANIVAALLGGWPAIKAAGINTPLRLAHFMAQIATETGGFTIYTESLNYSAERLMQVWPSHFQTLAFAQKYAHNPEALANYIYADANRSPSYRIGNTQPGDGWRYIGRGLIQTTGRDGYRKAGHENDPEALADPAVGLSAAIGEFVRSGCIPLADADQVEAVRRKINGGLIGIEDCRVWLAKAKRIFTAMADPVPPLPVPAPIPTTPAPPPPPVAVPVPAAPPAPAPTVRPPQPAPAPAIGSGFYWGRIKDFFRGFLGS
jgi:putative chitinase